MKVEKVVSVDPRYSYVDTIIVDEKSLSYGDVYIVSKGNVYWVFVKGRKGEKDDIIGMGTGQLGKVMIQRIAAALRGRR
jgi:hypothetical protein